MDRFTRKELKSDKFALEVQHSVEYVSDHRRQLIRWGSIAAAVVVLAAAIYIYRQYQHNVREEALASALKVQNANVGGQATEFMLIFPTQAEKDKASDKAFTGIATKYSGSEEGVIAEYYLGANAADRGNLPEAERRLKTVIDSGNADYAALAKLALAQVYSGEGKLAEGEKLIRSVMDHPTLFVSKDTATIALAHLIAPTKPQDARKLLEPLRTSTRSTVSRAALTALSDLSQNK